MGELIQLTPFTLSTNTSAHQLQRTENRGHAEMLLCGLSLEKRGESWSQGSGTALAPHTTARFNDCHHHSQVLIHVARKPVREEMQYFRISV